MFVVDAPRVSRMPVDDRPSTRPSGHDFTAAGRTHNAELRMPYSGEEQTAQSWCLHLQFSARALPGQHEAQITLQ
jgi:hypothetical protein